MKVLLRAGEKKRPLAEKNTNRDGPFLKPMDVIRRQRSQNGFVRRVESGQHGQNQQLVHQCPKCSFRSTSRLTLSKHFESFHVTFRCKKCPLNILGLRSTLEHVKKTHPDAAVDHYEASKDAVYAADRALHNAIKNDLPRQPQQQQQLQQQQPQQPVQLQQRRRFACGACLFTTADKRAWARHKCDALEAMDVPKINSSNNGKSVCCPLCSERFFSQSVLQAHMAQAHRPPKSVTTSINATKLSKRPGDQPRRSGRKRRKSQMEDFVVDVVGRHSSSDSSDDEEEEQGSCSRLGRSQIRSDSDTDSAPEDLNSPLDLKQAKDAELRLKEEIKSLALERKQEKERYLALTEGAISYEAAFEAALVAFLATNEKVLVQKVEDWPQMSCLLD